MCMHYPWVTMNYVLEIMGFYDDPWASMGLRPTPTPRSGVLLLYWRKCVCLCGYVHLLGCGWSCRLLLLHDVCRTSPWNDLFPRCCLSSLQRSYRNRRRIMLKSKMLLEVALGSIWGPWGQHAPTLRNTKLVFPALPSGNVFVTYSMGHLEKTLRMFFFVEDVSRAVFDRVLVDFGCLLLSLWHSLWL